MVKRPLPLSHCPRRVPGRCREIVSVPGFVKVRHRASRGRGGSGDRVFSAGGRMVRERPRG